MKINNKKGISLILIIILILVILSAVGITLTLVIKNNEDNEIKNNLTENDTNIVESKENSDSQSEVNSNDFLMTVEDVFSIAYDTDEEQTVVTGRVERGEVRIGDTIEIVGMGKESITTEVTRIEMFREEKDILKEGESAGLALVNISREEVERGQVLAKPKSIEAYTSFEAQITMLTQEKGGRSNPFFDGYKPEFYFRTIGINGLVRLENIEMVNPGDSATIKVDLTKSIAMEIGTEFKIREGGRVIGTGKVVKIN